MQREQAEAGVNALSRSGGEIVTKADLTAGLADLKADILTVAIGIVIANVGLTVALVELL